MRRWLLGALVSAGLVLLAPLAAVTAPAPTAGGPPPQLLPAFAAAAAWSGVPEPVLLAVAQVESGFNPRAVGPPVPGGPALGMMQFLPSSWQLFNMVPGATPFDPVPAVFAAANHLRHSGQLPGGGWSVTRALFGYNHSTAYVATVLNRAASFGYRP